MYLARGSSFGSSQEAPLHAMGHPAAASGRRSEDLLLTSVVLFLTIVATPVNVSADEVWVGAHSSMQIYDVGTPASPLRWERRRFVQTLTGRYARQFGGDDTMRLQVVADLRIEQDFDRDCDPALDRCFPVSDPERVSYYNPLVADSALEARAVYLRASGLPLGGVVEVGRQLVLGPVEMFRLDGLRVEASPHEWVSVGAYGGLRVRAFSWWSTDAFAPSGSLRLRLEPGRAAEEIDFVAPPSRAWVVGGVLRLLPKRWARVELSFREVWDADGLIERRGGLRLRWAPLTWLRVAGQAVLDLSDASWVHAMARLELDARPLSIEAGLQRRRSRYDLGTIWAYFPAAPVDEALVGVRGRGRRLTWGAGLRGRRVARDRDDLEGGAEAFADLRLGPWALSAHGSAFGGHLGPLVSAMAHVERPFFERLRVGARLSYWYFDDPLRATVGGSSIAEALHASWRLTAVSELSAEMQHSYNRRAGHRFRGMLSLAMVVSR